MVYQSRFKKGQAQFCSNKCKGIAQAIRLSQKISCSCSQCGKEFALAPSRIKRGLGSYCSLVCSVQATTSAATRACQCCGVRYKAHNGRQRYCSVECGGKARVGGNNHNWKGGLLTAICGFCKTIFTYKAKASKGRFCSTHCAGSWRSRNVTIFSTGKGGRREDLNGLYVRSSWEANWARYLNWLKAHGQIKDWQYEPETFEFHGIKRGSRFYTPDFCTLENDDRRLYYEIKGYMDQRSATKLKRMKKYHPNVRIELIERKQYVEVCNKVGALIPHWESFDREQKRFNADMVRDGSAFGFLQDALQATGATK